MSTSMPKVVSSDVLSVNRVNIAEEKSERVIWYKVCHVLIRRLSARCELDVVRTGSCQTVKSLRMWSCVSVLRLLRSHLVTVIVGQRYIKGVVGDTSAFAWVVSSSASPQLSTRRLCDPHSRTPQLPV